MMINFAFCCEREDELNYMRDEVVKCLNRKGIVAAVRCYRSARELQRCISCNCPDVLFYEIDGENGRMREVAAACKRENGNLVSVVTGGCSDTPHAGDALPEPVYVLPDRSRRHLWAYASLAYETALDDDDSFSYYVRPDYIHIPVGDIRYFASEGRRTHIVSGDCRDTFYRKLDAVEKIIRQKNGQFLRIHKSYLVNARYISGYSRDYVALTTGEKLRISRYEYYKALNDRFRYSGIKRCPQYAD